PDRAAAAAAGRSAQEEHRDWYKPCAPVYGTFVVNFLLLLVVSVALISAPPHLRFFTPAVGIILLLNTLVFAHVVLTSFTPGVSGDFVLLCLLTLVVVAGRAYKFRFPNMPPASAPVELAT